MQKKIGSWFQYVRQSLTWELGLYLLIVAGAAVLRFWQLDLRPIHYDEGSYHTYLSWQLSNGFDGYQHNPMGHGPVLYLLNALVYTIFGTTDYTSRIMPAIMGTLLVFLPYFLRRELGRVGALVASLLLALSPTMLFISRFIRHDVYDLVWTFMLVICVWRYMAERRARYIYISAVVIALGFATMETFFFTIAIVGSFLVFISLKELWLGVRNKFDFSKLTPRATFVIILGTLALPQLAAGLGVFQKYLGVTLVNKSTAMGVIGAPLGGGSVVAWIIIGIFILISAVIGWRWNLWRWVLSAVIFYFVYLLFFTTVFYNWDGFRSGIWDSLGYWLVQHGENRLYQPSYFYLFMLSVYEFLPVLLAVAGIIYFSIKRSLFSTFLIYWSVASLLLFTWAGEKAPWLVVHITLPLILLGSKFCGEMLCRAIDINMLEVTVSVSKKGAKRVWEGLAILVRTRRLRVAATLAMVTVLVFLLVFSARASWRDNYRHSDSPVEILDYAQVSYDMSKVMKQIDQVAKETGKGKDLKITVDNEFWWPIAAWYLRDYSVEAYGGSGEPRGDVLLLASDHESAAKSYVTKYSEGERFRYLLWFPTTYQGIHPKSLGDGKGWRGWWDYLTSRKTKLDYWDSRGIAYFPKGMSVASLPTEAGAVYNSVE